MNPTNERAAGGLWLDVVAALTLISALIYATGWTYAYHYFGHFKLGLLMLEIPVQYFFMYGFWVFKTWWWLLLVLYGLIMLSFLLAGFYGARRRFWLLRHGQVLLVLLAFWLAGRLAAASAEGYYREQQSNGFAAYPHVRVWPKTPLPLESRLCTLYGALPEGGYRLLLQNREALFLFKLPRDGKAARLAVTKLDLSEVQALKVLP